jgi:hypothetical protein
LNSNRSRSKNIIQTSLKRFFVIESSFFRDFYQVVSQIAHNSPKKAEKTFLNFLLFLLNSNTTPCYYPGHAECNGNTGPKDKANGYSTDPTVAG